jgi:hypothetical protein
MSMPDTVIPVYDMWTSFVPFSPLCLQNINKPPRIIDVIETINPTLPEISPDKREVTVPSLEDISKRKFDYATFKVNNKYPVFKMKKTRTTFKERLNLAGSEFKNGCVCGHNMNYRVHDPTRSSSTNFRPKTTPVNIKIRVKPSHIGAWCRG